MAVSGSIDFSVTRDDIITEALQIQGSLGDTDSPTSAKLTSMSRSLNMLVKSWQAMGLNLFALQRTSLFLRKDTSSYALGASTERYCIGEPGKDTLAAPVSSGATSIITSTDLSGTLSANDYAGILLDDNTLHWSTISSISGTTINLNTATDGAGSSGNRVYYYLASNQANRPMKIMQGARINSNGYSIPLTLMTRHEYVELSAKDADGDSVNIYYDPQITDGNLYVWTQPANEVQYLDLWVQKTLDDFDTASDNPAYPQEWYLPLAWGLARVTATKNGVPKSLREYINIEAERLYRSAEAFDTETSTFIQPDTRRR